MIFQTSRHQTKNFKKKMMIISTINQPQKPFKKTSDPWTKLRGTANKGTKSDKIPQKGMN
jgi:hypothetical protein